MEEHLAALLGLGAAGVAVGGLHSGESVAQSRAVVRAVRAALDALAPAAPLMVQGADSLAQVQSCRVLRRALLSR